MFNLGELATAVQEGVPVITCVFNDRGYGILRFIQDMMFEGRRAAVDLHTPDFAMLAQSMGMPSWSVASADEFEKAFAAAVDTSGPSADRRRHHRVRADADRAPVPVDARAPRALTAQNAGRAPDRRGRPAAAGRAASATRTRSRRPSAPAPPARPAGSGRRAPPTTASDTSSPSVSSSVIASTSRSSALNASLSRQRCSSASCVVGDAALDRHRPVADPLVGGPRELGDAHDDQLAQRPRGDRLVAQRPRQPDPGVEHRRRVAERAVQRGHVAAGVAEAAEDRGQPRVVGVGADEREATAGVHEQAQVALGVAGEQLGQRLVAEARPRRAPCRATSGTRTGRAGSRTGT